MGRAPEPEEATMTELYPPGVRRSTVTALGVVVGVLVAVAGLFVALFLVERWEIGRLDAELAGVERELASEREDLESQQSTVDELDRERDELETALADLRKCADPAKAAIDAGDEAAFDAAFDQVLANCGR
jgi:septal ring factor EnvC (AmiA/AmiB activator)